MKKQSVIFFLIWLFITSKINCEPVQEKPGLFSSIKNTIEENKIKLAVYLTLASYTLSTLKLKHKFSFWGKIASHVTVVVFMMMLAQSYDTFSNFIKKIANEEWWRLMLIGASSAALFSLLRINSLKNKIEKNGFWANWQPEYEKDLPEKNLLDKVLVEIQCRYTEPKDIENFNLPIQNFLKDVLEEEENLNNYIWWHEALLNLGVTLFKNKNESLFSEPKKRLENLSELKNLIVSWLSKAKTAKAMQRTFVP